MTELERPEPTAEPAAPAPPARRRSFLRRFYLMEERIAEAKATQLEPGRPGWAELDAARAAHEAACALLVPARRLDHSDGTAPAEILLREALGWTLAAHAARAGRTQGRDGSPSDLWEELERSDARRHLEPLDPDLVETARGAFAERAPQDAFRLEPAVRLAEVRALREVVGRLLLPLERDASMTPRLRWIRVGRLAGTLGLLLAMAVAAFAIYRWHRAGPNLALGRPATQSSYFADYRSSDGAVDGVLGAIGFHTDRENGPWWMVDLGGTHEVRRVRVFNRVDCCTERALPLVVELGLDKERFTEVARRTDDFVRWTARFAPTRARYVRLRADARTMLHLNEVEVYSGR